MYSLRPATLAYFVVVELACLAIELEVTKRQKTHRAFDVARGHHFTAIVHTRREGDVDQTLCERRHHPLSDIAVPTQDDALEDRLDFTPDNSALCRYARLVHITISRGRKSAMNELNAGDVVSECRNAKCFDRSLANHARRARVGGCDR